PDEDPLVAAKRELLEETGHEARHWISLGAYAVDGNRGAGTAYLYLATDIKQVGQITADDLEEQALLFLSRAEIKAELLKGAFKILPNATAVSMALLHPIQQSE
ncbi:MAG: NUDIX domain-containing protein, partial [Anaerolineae bacterium]|nr:NUDIX domain-containing protein [Anaerolineae bacterium]